MTRAPRNEELVQDLGRMWKKNRSRDQEWVRTQRLIAVLNLVQSIRMMIVSIVEKRNANTSILWKN